MTLTGYGRFIGRIGALAVALGIGVAIADSPGIAWAQDGASDSSPGGTDSSSAGAGTSKTDSTGASGSAATGASGANTGAGDADNNDPEDDDADDNHADDESSGDKDAEDNDADDEGSGDKNGDAGQAGDNAQDDEETANDSDESAGLNPPTSSEDEQSRRTGETLTHKDRAILSDHVNTPRQAFTGLRTATTKSAVDGEPVPHDALRTAVVDDTPSITTQTLSFSNAPEPSKIPMQVASLPTPATTHINGMVGTVLSALGFDAQAASGPAAPLQSPMLWAMLAAARREIGHTASLPPVSSPGGTVAALVAEDVATTAVSPLATPEQLEAERLATQTANSFPVALMKLVLRQQFLSAAHNLYGPGGVDGENMAALDRAVNEYAMGAAFQQLLLDSMNPTVVTQVAPPHSWFGQNVPGSRILYDNPDTIYRFMGVNGASQYEIRGQFHDWENKDARPSNITFSVLEGLAGTTTTVLTVDDEFEVDADGNFVITVSMEPANGRPNHLQLTKGSTIIAARDTLGDWNKETPMSLSIERVGGPPDSLFAQIGGFAFLGNFVVGNPLLTTLVSLIPPLPHMPPVLRGVFSAAILIVRGGNEQAKYMALATNDPETGEARAVNTVSQPASNAEFLANQLQSNGHFQLEDDQALVLTIDPGDAGYFVVPTYNIWTITDNYWDEPASLNMEQARENVDENGEPTGTYTVVISPTDPLAANWISTSGLNQGTLAIRFQDIEPNSSNQPRIVDQQVMTHDQLREFLAEEDFITQQDRDEQLALRRDGFDKRWT
ncbi:hypothetical protein ACIA48_08940 [Mycobacterium sp. NPDC051804]|uniref:hypothetical protein n=1 Tax=Mycobacterium sp. NPDC051804 TaxID=3364295 RepID=UPI0037B739D3